MTARTTSPAGRAAIMTREGCLLHAYRDGVGVLTIGCGHTGRMSQPAVTPDMTISRDEADLYLANDLAPVEAAIVRSVKVETTQNQHDAMASLAFNIGVHGFIGSTVVHKLGAGDPAGAAEAFLMWDHPPELRRRREDERAQFLRPDASGRAADPPPALARPVAGPHLLPVPAPVPGLWARIVAFLQRKVV